MNEVIRAPEFTKEMEPAIVSCVYFGVGDYVAADAVLLDIETEKVALEVCTPVGGTIIEFNFNQGESLISEQALLSIAPGPAPANTHSERVQESIQAQEVGPNQNLRGYIRFALAVVAVLALGAFGVIQWL